MLLDNYKKQSPIVGVAGLGGGINSYIFLSSDGYVISRSLKFDLDDDPSLTRSINALVPITTYTVSMWVKRGIVANPNLQYLWDSGGQKLFGFSGYNLTAYNGSHNLTTSEYRDTQAWMHLVFSVNSGTATIYVNNESVKTGVTGFSVSGTAYIGEYSQGNYNFDGCMADVHFVENQALSPTNFAKSDINGVWQPKKFDGTYTGLLVDQSQIWSSGMKTTTTANTSYSTTGRTTTFPDSLPSTSPFDVDLTNFLYSQTGTAGTWLYIEFGTPLTNVTSIVFSTEYSCPGSKIRLNNTEVTVDQGDLGLGYVEVAVTGTIPTSLTEIAIQGYGGSARLNYLKINGKLLLDPVNNSQTWSANATGMANAITHPASNVFDGKFSTFTYGSTLSIPFTGITVSSLRLWADGPANSMSVTLNDVEVNVPLTNSAATWITIPRS